MRSSGSGSNPDSCQFSDRVRIWSLIDNLDAVVPVNANCEIADPDELTFGPIPVLLDPLEDYTESPEYKVCFCIF